MLNYTAIDFETANSHRGSPCVVGLVRVRDGTAVAERRWLMRPPAGLDHFDPYNTHIHHITKDMVADKPRWKDIIPAIIDFMRADVVVAHNAGFDTSVIRCACDADDLEWPEMQFLCTMVLARKALPLPSYCLPFVLRALGSSLDNHHDPLADARAVTGVVRGLSTIQGVCDLQELARSLSVSIGSISSHMYLGCVAISAGGYARLAPSEVNPDADPDGYLYGRVLVFTGALISMSRQTAWRECARIGAITERDITKRTNVLVLGDVNPAVLSPGAVLTEKAWKAFELRDKGQDIEVMTEDDFLRCLDGKL